MKTTQPKPATASPAAAPVTITQPPAVTPQSKPPAYQPSEWSRVASLLEHATKDEREFFDLLIHEWGQGVYNLPEAALMQGARANGVTWITEVEDITGENDVLRGLKLAMLQGDWCARFLRVLLKTYDYNSPPTPDDVAEDLEEYLIAFQHEIKDARKLIQAHPETVAGEIKMAIQKRPELAA